MINGLICWGVAIKYFNNIYGAGYAFGKGESKVTARAFWLRLLKIVLLSAIVQGAVSVASLSLASPQIDWGEVLVDTIAVSPAVLLMPIMAIGWGNGKFAKRKNKVKLRLVTPEEKAEKSD